MAPLGSSPEGVRVIHGDCLDVLRHIPDASISAVITDPPYGLSFMGKDWDHGVPGVPFWEAALRVVKPGGYMLAMGGSRTYHRLACAVEDAGWEIRDCLMWLYGTGFPKGQGCLKPAYEPILLARRPGRKVLPLGIEECRIPAAVVDDYGRSPLRADGLRSSSRGEGWGMAEGAGETAAGRYPANLAHDGSPEVLEAFEAFGSHSSHDTTPGGQMLDSAHVGNVYGLPGAIKTMRPPGRGDTGTAARFFFTAKASGEERAGGNHPTVKPLALMRWLVKLVCPRDGLLLDPFAGSGTTGLAASLEDRRAILIEREADYIEIINRRLANHEPLFRQEAI